MVQTGRGLQLRLACDDDLPFVVATERLPGYERLTAQWSIEEHRLALQRSDTRYLIGEHPNDGAVAFVILQPVCDAHEGTKLKRICVSTPGRGVGTQCLAAVMDWVFVNIPHTRLWLDVFTYNERARHVYRRAGFQEDGLLRGAYRLPDGQIADRVIMSVLRKEWSPR